MKTKVPKLRFPEFSGEWVEKKLGEICNIIMGQSPSSLAYNENLEGLPLVQGNADCKKRKVIPRIYSSEITKESLPKDIIMSVRAPAGTIAKSDIHSCIGRGVCAIRSKIENQEYIYQYLINYEDKWNKYSQGSTFDSINSNDIKGLYTSFPSFPEQEKIASFLSKVDESIEILEEEKELWEKYKKGMMQKIFSQKLRFKDENGNDYPEWEEKKFKDIYTFKSTNSLSRDKLNYENGEIKNIHYGDIHTKFKTLFDITKEEVPFINLDVSFNKITLENYCKKGDLIIADASEDYADIGKCIEIINSDNQKILAGLHTFVARPTFLKVATGFGGYLMKSPSVYKQIRIIAQGTKVLSLSATRVADLDLYIPSLPEQEKIANFLSSIDEKIELIEKELEVVKEFKKGLLQQMFI
ncbi:restriction endonuclease subunit S [Cetobacterium sp.]|uniref:restriction endonuclease subunit S n=1 Tax=Cetobacterium sp. TaxID=2071632 RepID=UPI0025B90761|nr:restriction endonuclease subunit S [Cetobacterium sp.]